MDNSNMASKNLSLGKESRTFSPLEKSPDAPPGSPAVQLEKTINTLSKMEHDMTDFQPRPSEGKIQRSSPKNLPGFPQFSRFPAEIRHAIWEKCLPRRIVRIYEYCYQDFDREKNSLLPPVISKVCRESRMVACRNGKLHLLYQVAEQGRMSYGYETWFDGSHDILEVEYRHLVALTERNDEDIVFGYMELLRHAEAILIQTEDATEHCIMFLFADRQIRRTLRNIYIQWTRTEVTHRLRWNAQAIDALLGNEPFYILDLDNKEELDRVQQIQRLNLESQQALFKRWLNIWKRRKIDPYKLTFSSASDALLKAWVFHGNQEVMKRYLDNGRVKEGVCWIEKRIASMPRVQQVYVFERESDDSDLDEIDVPFHPLHDDYFWESPGQSEDSESDEGSASEGTDDD